MPKTIEQITREIRDLECVFRKKADEFHAVNAIASARESKVMADVLDLILTEIILAPEKE